MNSMAAHTNEEILQACLHDLVPLKLGCNIASSNNAINDISEIPNFV